MSQLLVSDRVSWARTKVAKAVRRAVMVLVMHEQLLSPLALRCTVNSQDFPPPFPCLKNTTFLSLGDRDSFQLEARIVSRLHKNKFVASG